MNNKLNILHIGKIDSEFEKEDYGTISGLIEMGDKIKTIDYTSFHETINYIDDIQEEMKISRIIANRISNLLSEKNYDCIFTHYMSETCTISIMLGKILNIPVAAMAHSSQLYIRKYEDINWKIRNLNKIITISEYNRKYIKEICPNANVETIYLGVDTNLFKPITKKGKDKYCLTVCRLIEKKGLFYLLESAKDIEKIYPEITFKIVGNGVLYNKLQNMININHIDNMELIGNIEEKYLITMYQNAYIFILPSIRIETNVADNRKSTKDMDGIPVSLMEAMSCGIPCISTNISGIPELITNNLDGIIIDERRSDLITNSVIKLMENKPLYGKMKKEARSKIMKKFNKDINIRKLHNSLKQI